VHLNIRWIELVTFLPLATLVGASLGLTIGTRAEPRQVPLVFSVIVLPITFLGATYYTWSSLTPIPWLKWLVTLNPLVYMSESFRTALTPQYPHMPVLAIYAALIFFVGALGTFGVRGFSKRVLT
jgi:ABC-2 type transport system permease protein